MDLRDAVMILKLNEKASITVDTPVGLTEEFQVENIVKQGTVYAVDICGAVMDSINKTGHGIRTLYGPDLVIKALAYVDDIVSAGSSTTSNNTIESCGKMEEKKRITFNTDSGKSAVMKANKKNNNNSISKQVKKGDFEEVDEYKLLGVWIDGKGKYLINIKKNQKKLQFMINSIKSYANDYNMGTMAVSARIKLLGSVIIQAILHGVEAFPVIKKEEEKELEKMQGKIVRDLMEVPVTTPYQALLLELGIPTMKARVAYRKVMLYHNLSNSDEKRIARRVIEQQHRMDREGTWLAGVKTLMNEYGIVEDVTEQLKSAWKRIVKQRIEEHTEEEIIRSCGTLSKARTTLLDGKHEIRDYLKESTIKQAKKIITARLHMTKIPCNYKTSEFKGCWLCGQQDDIRTEHYYECSGTRILRRNWNAKKEDLSSSDTQELVRTSMFLEKVVEIFKPKWDIGGP